MLKRFLSFTSDEKAAPANGTPPHGSANQSIGLMELAEECQRPVKPQEAPMKQLEFEQIYQTAAVKPPHVLYGILKVAEMAASPHLHGMSAEAKRCALLMALEAGGAEMEDLLQDAVVRQRALNDYAEKQQEKLGLFESGKAEENRTIQAELDRITGQYMARIQANLDEVARRQDALLAWDRRKQQESQRIADAAAYLVPQGAAGQPGGLAAVLERASQTRRPAV